MTELGEPPVRSIDSSPVEDALIAHSTTAASRAQEAAPREQEATLRAPQVAPRAEEAAAEEAAAEEAAAEEAPLSASKSAAELRRERDGLAEQLRAAAEQTKETEATLLQRLDRMEAPCPQPLSHPKLNPTLNRH